MLYDYAGREIKTPTGQSRVLGERLTSWEVTDRESADESRALSPSKLDLMFTEANGGDPERQARLAMEIEEKDWDVAQSLQTRRAAVKGLGWECQASIEDNDQAKAIAEEAEAMLRNINPRTAPNGEAEDVDFEGALEHMLSAILPGYSCQEVIWAPGGSNIHAFSPTLTNAITFHQSKSPLIRTSDHTDGLPLAPNKFVFHRHRARSGDATRGGLIRPLGWMYLFTNLGVKDLVRFIEKFGMPFVSARLDENAWEKDRSQIAYLIKNFGSDGGAVFSKSVELEFIDAVQRGGDIYFKLIEYMGTAKTKVIQGQTATSGDAGGFSKGQAQENVRQDILESDCEAIQRSVRDDILRPWVMFKHGPDAPVPVFHLKCEPPEDLKDKAELVKTLNDAGFKAKRDWVSQVFDIPLEDAAPTSEKALALAGEKKKPLTEAEKATEQLVQNSAKTILSDEPLYEEWLRPVQDAIDKALADLPDEPTEGDKAALNERVEALLKAVPGLFEDMEPARLEEFLAQAMYAGDVNGRLERLEVLK